MDTPRRKRSETYSSFLREFPTTERGTAGGTMLRHYWHPLCLSKDLQDLPYPVRMLGENLVAFRGQDGSVNLVGAQCPHRCASLEYAQIKPEGLSCSYHGWTFNGRGRCVDMPLEPANSTMKDEIRHTWYPVQEWAGIVWCYMGADLENPPPLPKIDILTRTDGELVIERGDFRKYSYLNFLENFADMGHIYVLHLIAPGAVPEELTPYCDMSVNTKWRDIKHSVYETDFGMKCVLVHDTADPERKFVNTWSIAMPAYWRFGGISAGLPPDFTDDRRESGGMLRIIDDEHFEIFRYTLIRPGNFRSTFFPRNSDVSRGLAEGITETRQKKEHDYRKYPAWEGRPPLEDLVIQESQGAIPPREEECLGSSDIGVALLRRIWRRSLESIAKGGTPKTVKVDSDNVINVDTFKGFAHIDEIELSAKSMPTSENGRGLIRDADGNIVFMTTPTEE